MDERLLDALRGFTDAIRQLRSDVQSLRQGFTELERRISALEQRRGQSQGIDDLVIEEIFDPPLKGSLEERVRAHPDVQRLLGNNNWRSTAEAAIAELALGKRCLDDSRRKTATWQQVKAVVETLRRIT